MSVKWLGDATRRRQDGAVSFRYRVSGVVVEEESGKPLLDVVVRAYDKDVALDDFLGETRTDADGRFSIVFTQVQFQDVFEQRPDLYLELFDASGTRLVATTRDTIRRNAGVEERYAIAIPREKLTS